MKSKKIVVLGKGTAGVLTMANFLKEKEANPNLELEWHFDSDIKPQAVGEGSPLNIPKELFRTVGLFTHDLANVDGTFKHGIRKINWQGNPDFYHEFPPGEVGYHFNATALQKYIFDKIKDQVKIVDANTTSDNIDASYVMDCSGTPKDPESIELVKYIPVNAAYVTQCYWDMPRFAYTLAIARPYGWVFGIPLVNRCSIGYMFNDTITSVEEVKEDVKHVFEQFNLTPSTTTNELHFKNYIRKENYSSRIAYNGNASFFLEPMEATSLSTMLFINSQAKSCIANPLTVRRSNMLYKDRMTRTERMIMLHYFAGSDFKTDFWEFAEERGRKCIEEAVKDENWLKWYNASKKIIYNGDASSVNEEMMRSGYVIGGGDEWSPWNLHINISHMGLNLYDKINALIK